jgi:hypothetical protein
MGKLEMVDDFLPSGVSWMLMSIASPVPKIRRAPERA